jgi:hypothetical protein
VTTSQVITGPTVTSLSGGAGSQTGSSTATCPSGKALLGGGATTTGSAGIGQSRPNGSSWEATAVRVTANADISVTAYAVCAA